jgi:hypothetical protein
MSNEVWSTTDGATWTLHADPPWVGKIWPNVVVWDDRLWILFGYTYGDPANGWSAGQRQRGVVLRPTARPGSRCPSTRPSPARTRRASPWQTTPALRGRQLLVRDRRRPRQVGVDVGAAPRRGRARVDRPRRSVFWVARAPFVPRPWGWIETFDPVGTIVGGPGTRGRAGQLGGP